MFNFGFMEMLALLAIAFLALGPEKFPKAARKFLKLINELKRAFGEIKTEFDETAEEAKRQISESKQEIKKLAGEHFKGFSLEEIKKDLTLSGLPLEGKPSEGGEKEAAAGASFHSGDSGKAPSSSDSAPRRSPAASLEKTSAETSAKPLENPPANPLEKNISSPEREKSDGSK